MNWISENKISLKCKEIWVFLALDDNWTKIQNEHVSISLFKSKKYLYFFKFFKV